MLTVVLCNFVSLELRTMFSTLRSGLLVLLVAVVWLLLQAEATELTFELPDRDKQCFYEQIEKGISCTLEYQVARSVYNGVADVACVCLL